ncbi:MAG: alpha/beta fold hydrolase [Agathobacter sp.]|nr:alpha/beta fold hydrolase [Agathobacter sp.]
MFEKFKADILFTQLLKRPDIEKAYAMVPPTDSWYDTITKVHNSLKEIQEKNHELLEITSHDNLKLKAVYYPSDNSNNITVICAHGYTSHAEREWAFPGLFYLSLGYNVLIPYQRAHGLSEGKYITFGALEHKDMLGWINKVNEMNPNDTIIIHGLSMGGGIALDLADKEMRNVKGIIADAPSVSIREFFQNVSKDVFKKEAEKVATHAVARFKKEFGADVKDFECVDIVSRSKYPILLSAGSMENMEKLFDTIKDTNPCSTDIIILEGCNHGNGMYKQTELYQNVIKDFIYKITR